MKISINWLKEIIEIEDEPEKIAEKLLMSGTETERMIEVGKFADDYKVVRVEKIKKVEGIRLPICVIFDGEFYYEVITGADVKVGSKYLWCPPGGKVKDSEGYKEIGVKEIKGVKSYGMLLSPGEIGYEIQSKELLEIGDGAEIGEKGGKVLNLPDVILDISPTPQRGDLLSHLGVALELHALFGWKIKFNENFLSLNLQKKKGIVSIEDYRLCPIYTARVIEGKRVGDIKTPPKIVSRLLLTGLRSINIVVDLTNYFLMELGQPTHAFDGDKVKNIFVRRARKGERILCLDGKERELFDDIVIADEKPIAIAGIIGGEETGVSNETKKIIIESALFSPISLRISSKRHVQTESSLRFSRGVNPAIVPLASNLIAKELSKFGFKTVDFFADFEENFFKMELITLPKEFPSKYIGLEIPEEKIKDILKRLHLNFREEKNHFIVEKPIHRQDISLPEDLVEEIARIIGYDSIPKTLPLRETKSNYRKSPKYFFLTKFLSMGFSEVKSYDFVPKKFSSSKSIEILNEISEKFKFLRENLLFGLLSSAEKTIKKGFKDLRIFEFSKVFWKDGENMNEEDTVGFLVSGSFMKKESDIFDIKGVFDSFGSFDFKFADDRFLIPKFDVYEGNTLIGFIGKVSKSILKDFEINQEVFFGQMFWKRIRIEEYKFCGKYVSELPILQRDFSVVGIKNWGELKNEILKIPEIIETFPFDIWKESISFRIFIKQNKTLTSEEISEIMKKVISIVENMGGKLREKI